jgi:hypothetical protein
MEDAEDSFFLYSDAVTLKLNFGHQFSYTDTFKIPCSPTINIKKS